MTPTRRAFFKISAGGAVASILGFDLRARLRAVPES